MRAFYSTVMIDLLKLSYWFEEKIVEKDIIDKYTQLQDAVRKNVNTSQHTLFEEQRENLLQVIQDITFNDLKGIDDVLNMIKEESNVSDGAQITALKKAIEKSFDFTNKGGKVDFIQPIYEDADEETEEDTAEVERVKIETLSTNI